MNDSSQVRIAHNSDQPIVPVGRRAFINRGCLIMLAGTALSSIADMSASGNVIAAESPDTPPLDKRKRLLRVGLITDLHYADKATRGSRHYRLTLGKLREAAARYKTERPDFVVELGDLIDAADSVKTELGYLRTINKVFAALPGDKHYVLGNHCVDMLTKREFLTAVGQKRSYYSFDQAGFHFVVLDSCFRSDGEPYGRKNFVWTDANVPQAELDWLSRDLKSAKGKVVVFAHQRLDDAGKHAVRNAAAVRKILSDSKKVLAVFQGHSHKNAHQHIDGIHYCTHVAMVEGAGESNNAYSTLDILEGDILRVNGFRKQQGYVWT